MGIDFEHLDVTAGLGELDRFQPNVHLAELNRMYRNLDPQLQIRIRRSSHAQFSQLPGIESLQGDVAQFLERFGHLSDSGNDFSSVPWRENPDLIVKMMTAYSEPEGKSASKLTFSDLKIPAIRRPLLRWVYSRARQFRLYREAIGSLYTFGYGLFRVYFLALGDHFVRRNILGSREDIFYLQLHEVRQIVEHHGAADNYRHRIADRKREISESEDIVPPTIVYGDQPVAPAADSGDSLQGTPTSRGQYTGPVKVVQSMGDFDKLKPGDVLVVPYSDVGWTPLFTKAGAVIAESGGILSHSSIIAREYGIPAVVSVFGACRLEDNTLVTVDGYRGEIFVRGSEEDSGANRNP
jgi:pyruvate,water dikinase